MAEINILCVKDIMKNYNLSRSDTYEILRSRGCPLIRGGDGKKYLIEQAAFERFLTQR